MHKQEKKKEVVFITGATSGIGYEMAKLFAKQGYDLILSGRNQERLEQIKENFLQKYKGRVVILAKDLSFNMAALELYKEVKAQGLEVDIVINNAGFGYVGEFCGESVQRDEQLLQVNVSSLTQLTKFFALEMKQRGNGKILNVASTGAYHPGPYTAVYYASKAYVLSFTEALATELRPYGVSICALCPGATKTNFSMRAGKRQVQGAMEPAFVAQKAYEGLLKNKRIIIPGVLYKLFVLLPKKIITPLIGRQQHRLEIKKN